MIKAITFDLDGVYFPNGKATFIKHLSNLGISEIEAKRVFLKSDQMNQQYKRGRMTDNEYWSWAADQWGVDQTPQQLIDLLIASYDVNPQVVEYVRSARTHGYHALICTNNFPARINGLQERFKFLDDFDTTVFSYEAGVIKPSAEIFNILVDQAGVPSSAIAYADDDDAAVSSAKSVGISAFMYENFDQFTAELHKLGVKI